MPNFSVVQVGGMSELALAFNKLSTTWRDAAAVTLNNVQIDVINQATIKQLRAFHVRNYAFDIPKNPPPAAMRATPARLQAVIALGNPDGDQSSIGSRVYSIFSKFGNAQVKYWGGVNAPIAIPTETIRPSIMDSVPRGLYPKNLRLVQRRDVTGILPAKARGTKRKLTTTINGVTTRGDDRTFTLPNSEGLRSWGVWQRVGPGKRDIHMIWKYEKQINVPHRLDFEADAQAVIAAQFPVRWDDAWARALGNGASESDS